MNETHIPETHSPDLESLAARVRLCKKTVADYKRGHALGLLSYDDLAAAGKELSDALFEYSRAKFPNVKPRRLPYQAIIR
jgi:hypothetical protein